jgi:hypothetical protein
VTRYIYPSGQGPRKLRSNVVGRRAVILSGIDQKLGRVPPIRRTLLAVQETEARFKDQRARLRKDDLSSPFRRSIAA